MSWRFVSGSCVLLCLWSAAAAQTLLPRQRAVPSKSRQFLVTTAAPRMISSTPSERVTSPTNRVVLTPGRLVLLSETVKTHFLRELKVTDQWNGQIRLHIDARLRDLPSDPIKRTLFSDGWQFQLILPERIRGDSLVRVLVDALLDEMSHRYTRREIDIPLWLRVGLTETILAAHGSSIILPSNVPVVRDHLGYDPLRESRQILQAIKPFTYADLSLPTRKQLAGAGWPAFRASAHVMTTELLRQRGSPSPIYTFIRRLNKHRNSQFAFLETFLFKNPVPDPQNPGQFMAPRQTMRDAEKWWSMTLTRIRTRDQLGRFSPQLSLSRLEEALAVSTKPDVVPLRMQQLITRAVPTEQKEKLDEVKRRLQVLQGHASPGLARLIYDYHQAIETYYRARGFYRKPEHLPKNPPPEDLVAKRALIRLDELDTIMADLHVTIKKDEAYGKTILTPPPATTQGRPFAPVPPPVRVQPKQP